MAVVPDKMLILREQIELMNENRAKIEKIINSYESSLINGYNNESNNSDDTSFPKNITIKTENTDQIIQNDNRNSNCISTDNESSQSISNTRQLRSNNSSSILKSNKLSTSNSNNQLITDKEECNYEIIFNLKSNDVVNELINNCNNNILKLKANLDLLIENNFDSIELSKLFKIEKISDVNDSSNYNNEKNDIMSIRKLVNLSDLKIIDLKLKNEIDFDEVKYNDEVEKRKKYKVNYYLFVRSFFSQSVR